jgi:NAD(P)H-quinone oxidoreductase subunit 4
VVNIVYGAFIAFAQNNLKRRIAFSSISHMGFVILGIASFNGLGLNGAVLQMVSHGLIAAALFFLSGVTYDRSHTLVMDKMSGMGKQMPVTFALFTIASMASLALPGMSGFVSELTVFLGFATNGVYSPVFRVAIVLLAAIGLVLTPMYLLSMLRRVFFGEQVLKLDSFGLDAKPRELFIAACLLVPVIGIGFYPKLATQLHDVKTTALAERLMEALPASAQAKLVTEPASLYSQMFRAPALDDRLASVR